ncbi:MAG: hypothetical protein WDM90_22960 [Ferruginibacter sp.]
MAQVKHHFISSHSIHDEMNTAVFEQYALDKAATIFKQHDVAVVVGRYRPVCKTHFARVLMKCRW